MQVHPIYLLVNTMNIAVDAYKKLSSSRIPDIIPMTEKGPSSPSKNESEALSIVSLDLLVIFIKHGLICELFITM